MALNCIIDSLDGVPDDIAKEYAKKGDKFELQLVGARTEVDVTRLQASLAQERAFSKELKAFKEACGENKPEEVITLLASIPELKQLADAGGKKLDQSQLDAIVNARLTPLQQALDKAKKESADKDVVIADRDARDRKRTVHDAVRLAAVGAGVEPTTYADEYGSLMLLADKMFTVDAAGQVVVSPGAPATFLEGSLLKDALPVLLEKHPYLRPPSQGGGAGGSKSENGAGANVFMQNNMQVRSAWINANQDKPGVVDNAIKAAGLTSAHQTFVKK